MQHTPLNDDEYDALDAIQDVSKLEGFLTALVVGPTIMPEAQWLPQLVSNAVAAPLALRHYHYMRTWMEKDPGSFEPIYECGGNWTAEAWCEGFLQGMQLEADSWAPLRASEPGLLAPFQRDGGNWAAKVAPAVVAINAFWHAPQPKAIKIGRNDPCPCGSGKKHKKCCGDDK